MRAERGERSARADGLGSGMRLTFAARSAGIGANRSSDRSGGGAPGGAAPAAAAANISSLEVWRSPTHAAAASPARGGARRTRPGVELPSAFANRRNDSARASAGDPHWSLGRAGRCTANATAYSPWPRNLTPLGPVAVIRSSQSTTRSSALGRISAFLSSSRL